MQDTRDALEQRQIPIYFAAVALAAVAAWALPGTGVLERAINQLRSPRDEVESAAVKGAVA